MSDASTPEPPPRSFDGVSCHDLLIADIEERKAFGLAKYGVTLRPHDGRRTLVDVLQELLDGAVYCRQAIEESKSTVALHRDPDDGGVVLNGGDLPREEIVELLRDALYHYEPPLLTLAEKRGLTDAEFQRVRDHLRNSAWRDDISAQEIIITVTTLAWRRDANATRERWVAHGPTWHAAASATLGGEWTWRAWCCSESMEGRSGREEDGRDWAKQRATDAVNDMLKRQEERDGDE